MANSFRGHDHLPNRRPDRQPPDPAGLPRQRRGITPQMHGRYPDHDILADAGHWDPVTRALILARVEDVPPRRFFTGPEFACLCAFSDVVLAQDAEPRIPVMSFVDAKLADGRLDGLQHVDMPDDRTSWRHVAQGLDEAARQHDAESFAHADEPTQRAIVAAFADGALSGGTWGRRPPGPPRAGGVGSGLSAVYP